MEAALWLITYTNFYQEEGVMFNQDWIKWKKQWNEWLKYIRVVYANLDYDNQII